jgi:AcrR family transcriptional regulator
MPQPTASSRPALTRDGVLQAAVALADARGLEALSMRKLGDELGVEAMSLYNHVANKEALLAGILELIVCEISLPDGTGDCMAALRNSAVSVRNVLRQHAWACALWTEVTPGPARLQYMEQVLATLRGGGFSPELAYHAYHVFDIYVVGFTRQELSYRFAASQVGQIAADFLSTLEPARYPHFAEHVQQHLEGSAAGSDFEIGLDLILDGLGRMRAAGGP